MQSRNRELCSSCRVVQKQVFSLWEAKTWGYVRPWFLFQFHEQPKKFCSCHPLPGLSMVACREAAQDLTTLVLRQSNLSSISLPFPEVFPASPHPVFCSAQTMAGRILSPTQSVMLCSKVVSLQDEQAVTRENNPGDQPVSISLSCVPVAPSGSHTLMLFSRPSLVLRVTLLWICHPCSHQRQS